LGVGRDWRDARIAEQETRIAEQETRIAEQETRIAEQETRIAEQQARIAYLEAQLAERDQVIARLLERITKLEEQLRQSSQNSSKPPSSDPPWLLRGAKKKPSGRKPGGQPGHRKHKRNLLPPERVDETYDEWPERCENCQHDLSTETRLEVGEAVRHQVIELPEIRAHVAEYRLHTRYCPHCQWATPAVVPQGVSTSCFGPRLQAVVAVCSGVYRLTKRTVVSMLGDLFDVEMALGSVTACEQRTSQVLAAPVQEARHYVEQQPVAYADETGWREARKRAWIWVAVTHWVTVFLVQARRNAEAAQQLLGRFQGVLVSDRWSAYLGWPLSSRQLCWAHLLRYFKAFAECKGAAKPIGDKLVALTKDMFRRWHRVRDGTLARSTFRADMRPVRAEVERLLEEGSHCGHPKVEATCRDILTLAPALWTFLRVVGVEPTNNAAERALRWCVLMRKISFGTHSAAGSRFIERMLTVAATMKQQGRNVVDYVTEACEQSLQGRPVPSLLPSKDVQDRALRPAA
jgi:transposase